MNLAQGLPEMREMSVVWGKGLLTFLLPVILQNYTRVMALCMSQWL